MQDEDFKFSGQNLTLPKAMQRTRRLLRIVLGPIHLVTEVAMLVLPKQGSLTIVGVLRDLQTFSTRPKVAF